VNHPSGERKIVVAECVEVVIRNGVVHVIYADNAEITLAIKKEMHQTFLAITQGKKMPFLVTNLGGFWIAKDAREFARKIEPKQPFTAVAYWAPSLGIKLMAEFYRKFYKPEIPYKVFGKEEEAIEWLRGYL
jgi:hypothetical protein